VRETFCPCQRETIAGVDRTFENTIKPAIEGPPYSEKDMLARITARWHSRQLLQAADRLSQDWDRLRTTATSDAERAEIDAIFARHTP
jgi:hypothetical protein